MISGERLAVKLGLELIDREDLPPGIDAQIAPEEAKVVIQPRLSPADYGFAAAHESAEHYTPTLRGTKREKEAFRDWVGAATLVPLGQLRADILEYGLNFDSLKLTYPKVSLATLVRRVARAIPDALARGWDLTTPKWQGISDDFTPPAQALTLERQALGQVLLRGRTHIYLRTGSWECWAWREAVSSFPKRAITFLHSRTNSPHWVR